MMQPSAVAATRTVPMPFGRLQIQAAAPAPSLDRVIAASPLARSLANLTFELRLGFPPAPTPGYRSEMAARGIYQGHNLGPPARVALSRRRFECFIDHGETVHYERLCWSCAIKVMCTLVAYESQALHLKAASLLRGDGTVALLVGRGQAGKTTLAQFLVDELGWTMGGNTHAFVQDGWAWGLRTWTRRREPGGDRYVAAGDPGHPIDGMLTRLYLVEKNLQGRIEIQPLAPKPWRPYFQSFVLATGAYDLKEDLADALGGDARAVSALLDQEQRLLDELLARTPPTYLSADLSSPEGRTRARDALGTLP
jgi:hypothetical protein